MQTGSAGSKPRGCRTCRRRKKGCDRAQPSCNQCLSANLVCGGYEQDFVWVNATTEEPEKRRDQTRRGPWQVRYATQSTPETSIVLRDSLARTAREVKYLGSFWSAYLPNGRAFSNQAIKRSNGGWTGSLGRLYDSEPTLRLAALAISASVLGCQAGDTQLRIKGLQTYSKALEEMKIALNHPTRWKGDGLLAAVRVMELYEIFFGMDTRHRTEITTQVSGWRSHNDGLLSLVLAKGPKNVGSGAGHQLFADCRLNIFCGVLTKRIRSPLSDEEWKTLPWIGREKSTNDKIMDILVDMTDLLEQLDNLRGSSPSEAAGLLPPILTLCKTSHDALLVFEQEMGDDLFTFDCHVMGDILPLPREDKDVAHLQITHLYWSTCLLLYSTLGTVIAMQGSEAARLQQRVSEAFDQFGDSFSKRYPRTDAKLYATKIARSISLFWEPDAGTYGNHMSMFPLALCMQFLAGTDANFRMNKDFQQLAEVFHRPFLGQLVGSFVRNLGRVGGISGKTDPEWQGENDITNMWWGGKATNI